MTIAIVCIALLALLVFGLGFATSLVRSRTGTNFGFNADPRDPLYKMVRAHGNACEYSPMLAVLIYVIAASGGSAWMLWTGAAAVLFRYLHAAGIIASETLEAPQPLRFVGALGTYIAGLVLVVAVLLVV